MEEVLARAALAQAYAGDPSSVYDPKTRSIMLASMAELVDFFVNNQPEPEPPPP